MTGQRCASVGVGVCTFQPHHLSLTELLIHCIAAEELYIQCICIRCVCQNISYLGQMTCMIYSHLMI